MAGKVTAGLVESNDSQQKRLQRMPDTQTDIQTYRHTHRQTYRHTHRQTDRQTHTQTDIQTYTHSTVTTL